MLYPPWVQSTYTLQCAKYGLWSTEYTVSDLEQKKDHDQNILLFQAKPPLHQYQGPNPVAKSGFEFPDQSNGIISGTLLFGHRYRLVGWK